MIGLVYYADDPHRRVFRTVYPLPGEPDSVLDDPKWTTDNIAPGRTAALDKAANANGRKHGTVGTAADQPIVYALNFNLLTYNAEQWHALYSALAIDPAWPIIDLGFGVAATQTLGLIAPCIILIAIDGGIPVIGSLTRTTNIGAQSVALWTA